MVQGTEKPFEDAVHEVQQRSQWQFIFSRWVNGGLLATSAQLKFANGALDVKALQRADEEARHVQDQAEANESNDYLVRLLLVHTLEQVAGLCQPHGGDLDDAEEEGSGWRGELVGVAK